MCLTENSMWLFMEVNCNLFIAAAHFSLLFGLNARNTGIGIYLFHGLVLKRSIFDSKISVNMTVTMIDNSFGHFSSQVISQQSVLYRQGYPLCLCRQYQFPNRLTPIKRMTEECLIYLIRGFIQFAVR